MIAWYLRAKYSRDVSSARVSVPPHRERLDRIVAGDAQSALGVGLTAGGLLVAFDVTVPDVGLAPATPVLIAIALTAAYLSGLFDWYVTLPRVTGLLGDRPCRTRDAAHPSYPRSWRETTRWWYIHRILAALILRFGLAYALIFTINEYVSVPGGANVVGAAVLGGLASYMAAVPPAIMQAGHPTAIVGATVHVREAKRETLPVFRLRGRSFGIPLLKRSPVRATGLREYVVDVALEGAQFVDAEQRERRRPLNENRIDYARHPRKVRLGNLHSAAPADRSFSGCDKRCSGVNWYCIENPRCFEPK